jgi:hypothetical protein
MSPEVEFQEPRLGFLLRFIRKNGYLKVKCTHCGIAFTCSAFCFHEKFFKYGGWKLDENSGCLCAECDNPSPEWKRKCRKGELINTLRLILEASRRNKNGEDQEANLT